MIRKKILFLIILLLFLCVSVGHAGEKKSAKDNGKKIRLGKEKVIVINDGKKGIYHPRWCGNDAFIYQDNNDDIKRIDITTGKEVLIKKTEKIYDISEGPIDCTPDGKWVVYNRSSFRPVPLKKGEKPPEDPSQQIVPRVWELFFYEVATGMKNKFAESVGISSSALAPISPDGLKIFLGQGYSYDREAPGPKFKPVWFSDKKWGAGSSTFWFDDSSGMVTFEISPIGIAVEVFGDNGWSKLFKLSEFGEMIGNLNIDDENRVYYRTENDIIPTIGINSLLYRCTLKEKGHSCEKVLEIDDFGHYEILPGGDIIFAQDDCIYRATPGKNDYKCIIENKYENSTYDWIILIGLSPDRKRLAFERSYGYRGKFFVVELIDD